MNRKSFLLAIVIAAVVAGATAFAQQQHRAYNLIMKDVAPTFANLKKNLDAMDGAAAAQDAATLQGLFSEVEGFWAPLDTQDAVGFAKKAQEAATAVGTASKANDMKAALVSYAAVQRTCGSCHTAHRDQTQAGFSIKP